jgi:hypothetical protein
VVKRLVLGIGLAAALGAFASARPNAKAHFAGIDPSVPLSALPPSDAPEATSSMSAAETTTTFLPAIVHTTSSSTIPAAPVELGVLLIGDSVLEGLNILDYRFGPDTR